MQVSERKGLQPWRNVSSMESVLTIKQYNKKLQCTFVYFWFFSQRWKLVILKSGVFGI